MTEAAHRHLVIWEGRHDNGWTTLVIEQSDGTFVAWAGPDESVGVDYVEDCARTRAGGGDVRAEAQERPRQCSIRCSAFEMRTHTMLLP